MCFAAAADSVTETMQETEFYFLPGLEDYSRLAVVRGNGRARLYWQVLAPRAWAEMTRGRPVEELPRLLGRYSAAHHLAAAQLLDRLFGVEPPPLAVNLRELLRQVEIYRQHLRRFYFLLLLFSQEQPRVRRRPASGLGAWIPQVQQHLALIREVAAIVGGRPEHPLTAVVGGVSRYLKPEHYPRLRQIGTALAAFTQRLADFLDKEVLAAEKLPAWETAALPPVITLSTDGQQLRLIQAGREQRLPLEDLWSRLDWQQETWTYEPLVSWRANGETSSPLTRQLVVGPVARLLSDTCSAGPGETGTMAKSPNLSAVTPYLAWEARRREMLTAITTIADLAQEDKLTGPDLRTIPAGFGEEAQAAVEGPDGLIQVACRVNRQGQIQELQLLDPDMVHQALKQAILQGLEKDLPVRPLTWVEQGRLAITLLPW